MDTRFTSGPIEPIYARDLDGTGSMHICSKEDPGAVAFVPETPMNVAAPELYELVDLVNQSFGGGKVMTFSDSDIDRFAAVAAKARGEK